MSNAAYTVEHARCLPGTTCRVRDSKKNLAPLWMIQLLMRIENKPGEFKVYHDCDAQGCPYKTTGKHVCSFGCNHETKLKSNMSIHENGQHAGLRTHCEKAGCRFTWTDLAAYSKHKKTVHRLPPISPAKRNMITSNKQRSQASMGRHDSRENSVLSETSWYYASDSSTWSSSIPTLDQPSSLPESDVYSSSSRPPSTDLAYTSAGSFDPQSYGTNTLNQHMSSFPVTSATSRRDLYGASSSSYVPSTIDTSLVQWPSNDGSHDVYGNSSSQTSAGYSLAYGNEGSDRSFYPKSSATPASWDSILDSNEQSTASDSSYGSGSYWPALEELLATAVSDISFDPALETTVQLGYLNDQPDASAAGNWYSSVPM